MAKSIEQMYQDKQNRINEAIKKKELRFTEQKLSINNAWAINCTIASMSEKEKELPWEERFTLITDRYQSFIDEHRIWLLDNLPAEERPKLTRQDYAIAQAEAPKSQAEEDLGEEERLKAKLEEKVEEQLPIIEYGKTI